MSQQKHIVLFVTLWILFLSGCSESFAAGQSKLSLTEAEKAYIAQIGVIKAVSVDGAAPIQYADKNGQVQGISKRVLQEVAELTGLRFEYQLYGTVREVLASDATIVFGVPPNYAPPDMILSKPYLRSETILYINSSHDPNNLEHKQYAAVKGSALPEGIKQENAIYFDTREQSLDAVEGGKADYGYGNAYSVAFYTLQNGYKHLVTIPKGKESRAYSIGFLQRDEILLSIINKALSAIGEGQLENLVLEVASQVERKITFSMVMNVYTKEIAVIVFIVVSILLFAITSYIRANKTLSEREARYHALMEQSSEALAVVNIETREIVEVNRQYTELFGYSLPEDSPLYVSKVIVEPEHTTDNRYTKMLKDQRLLPMETITFRHKNGTKVLTERGGTVVTLDGRDYLLASMRDMTEERRREAEVAQDVELAKWVQLELLPDLPVSPHFTLRSLYFLSHGISGDSYQVEWKSEGNILRGFLLDVSGHGVSTALQSASVSVLLREAVTANTSLQEQVQQVNIQASKYFVEGSYAALLAFELDFSRRELRYVGAGITRFYHNGRDILTPGMLVGLLESAQYTTGVLPVETGDCLHFLTDGFTDVLAQPEHAGFWSPDGKDFATDVASLERLAEGRGLRDDASGICLVINAFS